MDTVEIDKKERYEQKRKDKERETDKQKRARAIKRSVMWIGVLLLVAGCLWALAKIVAKNAPTTTPAELSSAVTTSDWVRGNKDSKVVLLEYADFQCPACGAYNPLLEQLYQESGDKIQIVYRNFPLSQHKNAWLAAQAAGAAGLQGKFWEMENKIFENQRQWSELANPRDTFIQYAESLGLDVNQFKKDIDSKQVKDKISSDQNGGNLSGIDHTPTFFLNGKEIQPTSYDELKNLITQSIKDNS